ncbi:MAG: hypothetical protein J5911_05815 [Clostridia bacterium]|nr:hypothetical protein [Clostridia bacterium]
MLVNSSNLKKYKNKYFSILGDSISTFQGVSVPKDAVFYDTDKKLASGVTTADDTWWGIVINALGGKLLVNNSISGSTVTGNKYYKYESYGCSDERTSRLGTDCMNPDVIIVYLGTNDWGHAIKIAYDPASGGEKRGAFESAYQIMLEKIIKKYPTAEIWCFTPATSFCSSIGSFEFPYYCGGWHISEYCKVIRDCAEKFGCRLIELFNDKEPFDTIDGFHPNKDGMKKLAENVLSSL